MEHRENCLNQIARDNSVSNHNCPPLPRKRKDMLVVTWSSQCQGFCLINFLFFMNV